MASSRSVVAKGVFLEQLQKPSLVEEPKTPPIETASLEYEDTWMAPIYEYLQKGSIPKTIPRQIAYPEKPKCILWLKESSINEVLKGCSCDAFRRAKD